jgi:diacylglycerol O-acyltransferase
MTEAYSTLDEFFLQIETPHRSTHWAVVVDLGADHSSATHAGGAPITEAALRTRVAERIQRYPMFSLGAEDRRSSAPVMREYDLSTTLSCVSSAVVADEHHYRDLLSTLLAQPLTRDRPSWRAVLIDQQEPRRQRLAVLGHHSMSDGVAAAGYAALFIDGDDTQLRQLDRYLTSDRYDRPSVTRREFFTGARTFAKAWAAGARSRRLPRLTTGTRRAAWTVEIPTREVRSAAAEFGAGTGEFLVAAVGSAVAYAAATVGGPAARPTTLRAFLPATFDEDFRHRGNASSMVLVNFPGQTPAFADHVATTRQDLSAVFDAKSALTLPTLSQLTSWLPWRVRRRAARATLSVLAPDVHVGVNPGLVNLRSILGRPITAIRPLSPLVGNPLSFTCLILGRTVHIGIVWDPGALGGQFGVTAAQRITELVDPGGASTHPDSIAQFITHTCSTYGG